MEYLIITFLLFSNGVTMFVLAAMYWRKRVWKRRATKRELGFWGLVREQIKHTQEAGREMDDIVNRTDRPAWHYMEMSDSVLDDDVID